MKRLSIPDYRAKVIMKFVANTVENGGRWRRSNVENAVVYRSSVIPPVLDQGAWLTPCCDHPLL